MVQLGQMVFGDQGVAINFINYIVTCGGSMHDENKGF
jgi:hypothetical protein